MERQAARLGLTFDYLDAVDALFEDIADLRSRSRSGPLGALSDGDLCCFLSHRKAWEAIRDGAEPFGAVLEDDVVLADDAAAFLGDADWIPPGERLLKLERFGNRRHKVVLARKGLDVHGRVLRRFHSKNVGAAAYVVSKEVAGVLVDASRIVDLSIDHFLFNPNNSPISSALRPTQVEPALAEQGGEVSWSDIHGSRVGGRTYDFAYWKREAIRGWYEIRLVPKLAWLVVSGRAELRKLSFENRPAPVAAERARSEAA